MSIAISDPFEAAADPDLPTLALALNPLHAKKEFKRRLPRLSRDGRLCLQAIRVIRHKPGRRCVLEYDVEVERSDAPREHLTLIGKVRARRSGNEGFRQLESIWNAGFAGDSADGVSVPEPIGVISRFQMWIQRKVAGETATRLLAGPGRVDLARRIAQAARKIHCALVPTDRTHSIADELRILRDCLTKLAAQKPELTDRLQRLIESCEQLGARLPTPQVCGIHRDFYPAQVLVDGARLWVIDFDLYCWGDPGLDIGNFLGHVIEQALREHGQACALADVEQALEERFVQLAGRSTRRAVSTYTTLTLARHVYLSQQFFERTHLLEPLLELCEQRLFSSKWS